MTEEERKEYDRQYYLKHRGKIIEKRKQYYEDNRGKFIQAQRCINLWLMVIREVIYDYYADLAITKYIMI